jgi:hypothetical protein
MFQKGKYKGKTYEELYASNPEACRTIATRMKTAPYDFKLFMINKLEIPKILKFTTCTNFCDNMDLRTKLSFNLLPIEIIEIKQNINLEREKNLTPSDYGTFIDYLARYYLMFQRKQKFYDEVTEKMISCGNTNNILKTSYEKTQNLIAVPQDLFNISIHSVLYRNQCAVPPEKPYIIENNYDSLFKWLENIKEQNILLGPTFDYKYLRGEPDLILNNEILVDIKTSSLPFEKKIFNQLLIYAALFYKTKNIFLKKLVIWNFIQGMSYEVNINEKIIIQICEILNF